MKIINRIIPLIIYLVIIECVLFWTSSAYAKFYIDITKPCSRKLPLALPDYMPISGNNIIAELGTEGARILSNDLAYTGLFDLVEVKNFLGVADQFSPHLWRRIGVEFLVAGNYSIQEGEAISLEMRLYDVADGRLIVGKRYSGVLKDLSGMMHRFADEIMLAITGERSIFSTFIAFTHADNSKKEIWMTGFDGIRPHQFTHRGDITLYPTWSPDGMLVAYTSYVNRQPVAFIQAISSQEGHIIYNKPGVNLTPVFSPIAGQMVVSLSYTGKTNIYMGDQFGNLGSNLTDGWGIEVSPSFSPDGKKMVFVSDRAGSPQIYIRDMISGTINRLSFGHKYAAAPDWSPRGDRIAYQAIVDGIFQIISIRPDGSDLCVITNGQGGGEDPSWSPGGNFIAYASRSTGRYQIYVMTSAGQLVRRITDLSGENTDPAWSPRGVADKNL